ncbi:MAG: family 10 glycosylhydrolase [Candidatus Poribacteria bacterium]|nr:family 10 glycosylhydrolase [Candidatus Poribacteria bacterium]
MMSSTRFASKNLRYTADNTSQVCLLINARSQGIIRRILLVCTMLWIANGHNFVSAQQAKIAIVLPSVTSQTSEGDVQYVRSVSKRFNRMLNSIGFTADTLEEASLSKVALQSRRLIILPLNSTVTPQTTRLLQDFVAKRGKLFVTYNLPNTVAPLLGLQQTDWLKDDPPGRFSTIQLRAPEVPDIPTAVRQASWNITVAEPTTSQTKIIGYWHDATGKSTGLPALFMNEAGVFFSHIFLPDDIQTKTRLLAALLGHLVPEFRQTLAEQAIAAMPAIGHTKTFEKLEQFVQRGGVQEAIQALKTGSDLMEQAGAAYQAKNYNTAITTARASRETLSEAYFLSHTSIETEGRAVWNHSGLGAYPGDWNRSAKELAAAGINMILPNMAWAGVAHYPSQVLPESKTFLQYGDQLAQCVTAAREYGLEVHVWKITWNLEGAPKEFIEKLRETGRTQVSATGEALNWLCPSHPENVQLELGSVLEIVTNYDVDGIHLDYIRYPGSHACYCDECRKRFVLATRLVIEKWPAEVLA